MHTTKKIKKKLLPFASFFFLFLTPIFLFSEKTPLFTPPSGWECASPKAFSSHVCIGFVGSGKNIFFRPSINLATEQVDISLKEYVQAVKKIHLADPLIQLRDLGETSCKIGTAHLLELSSLTPYGEVRMLQFISLYEHTAYLLTGAVLKEEYLNFYSLLLQSFHSLILVDDLSSLLTAEEKEKLEKQTQELKNCSVEKKKKGWESFQNYVQQNFKEQGSYWKILFLKKNYEDLLKNGPSQRK
jgi:hypothetical protein